MENKPVIQQFIYAKRDVPQLLFVLNRLDCDYPNASVVVMVFKNIGPAFLGLWVYEYKGVMLQ